MPELPEVETTRRGLAPHMQTFRKFVQKEEENENTTLVEATNDAYCLALLKHYHSLMPMAMEVRKPIFLLKPADGAIGAHFNAVKQVYKDFTLLTQNIIDKINEDEQIK